MSAALTPRQQPIVGVVVRVCDFGDSHRIVEVISHEVGRLSVLARNARASRRRFAGALDVFTSIRAQATPKAGLWILNEAVPENARIGIRTDLARIGRAAKMCSAARALLPEQQPVPEAFVALVEGLNCLDQGDLAAATRFYPRLLDAAGILPELAYCNRCGARGAHGFDRHRGALVCARCEPSVAVLPAPVLAGFLGAGCADEATATELESCAVAWIEAHTGRALWSRSLAF